MSDRLYRPKRRNFPLGREGRALYRQALQVWALGSLAVAAGVPARIVRQTLAEHDGGVEDWSGLFRPSVVRSRD